MRLITVLAVALLCLNTTVSAQIATPSWYEQSYVHAHTRLWYVDMPNQRHGTWWQTPEYSVAPDELSGLGVKVITRHAKSYVEDPWWPSRYPSSNGTFPLALARLNDGKPMAEGENRVAPWLGDPRFSTIAYYWISSSDRVQASDSQLVCRDRDGATAKHEVRGTYLDFTAEPYASILLEHFNELMAMGAKAIYIDGQLLSPGGCYSESMVAAYKRETGIDIRSTDNPYLHNAFRRYGAARTATQIALWQDQLRAVNPDFLLIVSMARLPGLTTLDTSLDLLRKVVPKSEYTLALRASTVGFSTADVPATLPTDDLRNAFAFMMMRDISGQPPHIWIDGIVDPVAVKAAVLATIAFGAIANVDLTEEHIAGTAQIEDELPREYAAPLFELGNILGPAMSDLSPVQWAAIYFTDAASQRQDIGPYWADYVSPMLGSFDQLRSSGVPITIVGESELISGLGQSRAVVISQADQDALSDAGKAALQQFNLSGGLVVTPENVSDIAKLPDAPVVASGLPAGAFVNAYGNPSGKLVVSVTNAFSWAAPQEWRGGKGVQPPPPAMSPDIEIHVAKTALGGICSSIGVRDVLSQRDVPATVDGDRVTFRPGAIPDAGFFAIECRE